MCNTGIPNEVARHHIAAASKSLNFLKGDPFRMKKENGAYRATVGRFLLFSNGQPNAGIPRTVTGSKDGYSYQITLLHPCGNNKRGYILGTRTGAGRPGLEDTDVWVTEEDDPKGSPPRR